MDDIDHLRASMLGVPVDHRSGWAGAPSATEPLIDPIGRARQEVAWLDGQPCAGNLPPSDPLLRHACKSPHVAPHTCEERHERARMSLRTRAKSDMNKTACRSAHV